MIEMKDVDCLQAIEVSNTFVKLCDGMLAAVGAMNLDTGIIVEIAPAEKLIFARMQAAYKFHSTNNRDYFESQDVIADSVGVERKKVATAVDKFVKLGLITQVTKYVKGLRRNFYTFHDFVDAPNIVFIKRFTDRSMVNGKVEVNKELFKYSIISGKGESMVLLNRRSKQIEGRSIPLDDDDDLINYMMFEQRTNNETNNYEYAAMQFGEI